MDRCASSGSRFVRQNGIVALGTGRHGVVAMRFVCLFLGDSLRLMCVEMSGCVVECLAVVCKYVFIVSIHVEYQRVHNLFCQAYGESAGPGDFLTWNSYLMFASIDPKG